MVDAAEKWWERVSKRQDGCWEWTGSRWARGYGRFYVDGRRQSAHRWGYEHLRGPISEGLELDHLCRNTWCVNPKHLEPVEHLVNVRRGVAGQVNRARALAVSHCPAGHPYDHVNTRYLARGSRACRTCDRVKQKQRRAAARRQEKIA
jgi:hypothetical protein